MKIIYDDKDIVVCIKPYGVISQNNDKAVDREIKFSDISCA